MSNTTDSGVPAAPRITLYKCNRLDPAGTWSIDVADLAAQYAASPWCGSRHATDTALRIFLGDSRGPIASVYDDSTPEFALLVELATDADRIHRRDQRAGVA